MSMPLKNVIISMIMLLIGSSYLYFSLQLPVRSIGNVPGPSFFPLVISAIVLFLAAALLVNGIVNLRNEQPQEAEPAVPKRVISTLVWFVLYLIALPYVGFLVASVPFFAGLMMLCEQKKLVPVAIGSILIPVFLYFLFRQGFNILLPAGQWM